jgi:hypothetical protein
MKAEKVRQRRMLNLEQAMDGLISSRRGQTYMTSECKERQILWLQKFFHRA